MSEREGGSSGFGPFLLGVSVGAVLGFLFAPEPGEGARGRLSRKLRGLRDLAADKVEDLGEIVGDAALERRLSEAKHRRRAGKSGGRALPLTATDDEEDEPVA